MWRFSDGAERQTDTRPMLHVWRYGRDQRNNEATTKRTSNKADIDCRLRPRCCLLGSYFKRPKSSQVRPLACNGYYCAQFITKPKASCALCFSWAATSPATLAFEQIWRHRQNRKYITPPQKDRTMAIDNMHKNMHKNLVKIVHVVLKIWSRADKRTHTDKHAHHNTPLACRCDYWPKRVALLRRRRRTQYLATATTTTTTTAATTTSPMTDAKTGLSSGAADDIGSTACADRQTTPSKKKSTSVAIVANF